MEDKLTEFEEKVWMVVVGSITDVFMSKNKKKFIADLRKIMPPVCTPNERKFLDEVKEKAKLIRPNVYVIYREPHKIGSVIFAKDFEANLSELVEGKQ
jgi:hypothetical protein